MKFLAKIEGRLVDALATECRVEIQVIAARPAGEAVVHLEPHIHCERPTPR